MATGPEGLTELQDKGSKVYVDGICMVAAFGGLLFGYDTAVISGTASFIALVVPEAKASGLPILTTRCEGVEELIEDNGVVIPRPDAEAFALALSELAADPGRHARMSAAARAKAMRFTWPSVAEQYLQAYREVVARTRATL